MTQQRKTKTEQRILHALVHLLHTKGLEALTVSDVTREAGINRGTFYNHYVNKYDLVEKQIGAVIDILTSILLAPGSDPADAHELIPRKNTLAALRYIKNNLELVATLTSNGSDPRLQERIKDAIRRLIERKVAGSKKLTLSYGGIPRDYGREMLLSSFTSVIWLWLRRGCTEPPEQICDIISANKDLSPSQLLD
jgi:AcrR family transcriptional regulator